MMTGKPEGRAFSSEAEREGGSERERECRMDEAGSSGWADISMGSLAERAEYRPISSRAELITSVGRVRPDWPRSG